MTEPDPSPPACTHPERRREFPSGFAAPETICTTCGQAFDPDEEARLRARDAAQRSNP